MSTYENRAVVVAPHKPAFSLPSILAIVAALVSFSTGAGWGFVLAIVAILLGVIGVLLSLLPNKRGGIISVVSIVAGAIGIVAALIKLLV